MPNVSRNPANAKPVGTLTFVLTTTPANNQLLFDKVVARVGGRDINFRKPHQTPGRLAIEIKEQFEITLGNQYTVLDIRVSKGSVVLTVVAGTYVVYQGLARYKNFVDSVKLLSTQIEALLHRNYDDEPLSIIEVKHTWALTPTEKKTQVQQQVHLKQ